MAERVRGRGWLQRFLADASHDLRTPLISIRGYAEMFDRGGARQSVGERTQPLATGRANGHRRHMPE